jgi:hypothetical protein
MTVFEGANALRSAGVTEWLNYEPLGPAELRQMTKSELAGCVWRPGWCLLGVNGT